jgi:hypothetical protein
VITVRVNKPEFDASPTWHTYSEELELSGFRVADIDSDSVYSVALTGGSRKITGNIQSK